MTHFAVITETKIPASDAMRRAAVAAATENARERRYSKEPPQAIPYDECLRRLLNRQRTVMA